MADATCSIDGCDGKRYCRGWCTKHYARWRMRDGDLTDPTWPTIEPAERFWARVQQDDDTGCWEWTGELHYSNGLGYGDLKVNKRMVKAHRFAWELLVGPIPDGLTIDHLCRNTSCVNPGHLEPVTLRVNVLRGEGPMAINARKTHCPQGHEYTPENTAVYRHSRSCRACHRARSRVRYQRRMRAA